MKKGQCWSQLASFQTCPALGLTSLVLCFHQTNSSSSAVGHVLSLTRPRESHLFFFFFPLFLHFLSFFFSFFGNRVLMSSQDCPCRHQLSLAPSQGHRETIAALRIAIGPSCPNSAHPRALPAAVCTILAAQHHYHGGSNTSEKPNRKKKKEKNPLKTPKNPNKATFFFLVYGTCLFRLADGLFSQTDES